MRKKYLLACLPFILTATTAIPALADTAPTNKTTTQTTQNLFSTLPATTVVTTIGDKKITVADLDNFAARYKGQVEKLDVGTRRVAALKSLLNSAALTAEAKKLNLDNSPEYKQQLNELANNLLIAQLIEQKLKAAITPAMLQQMYKTEIQDAEPEIQYHAHHILTATKADAEKAIQALNSKKSFADVAKQYSTESTKNNGGDLGYFYKEQVLPELTNILNSLKIGQYNKVPVQSQYGWHILLLDEKKTLPKPSFEQVEPELRNALSQKLYPSILKTTLDDAMKHINVVFPDSKIKTNYDTINKTVFGG